MKRVLLVIFALSIIPLCLAGCSDKMIADEKDSFETSVEKYIVKQEVKKYKKALKHAAYLKKLKLEQKKHAKKGKKKHKTVHEKLVAAPISSVALVDGVMDCDNEMMDVEGCLDEDLNGKLTDNELAVTDASDVEKESAELDEKELDEDNVVALTEDFATLNAAFYEDFSEAFIEMSNAVDTLSTGMASDDFISNAIENTVTFNELLDTYLQTAMPQSEKDQALYHHTIELIEAERAVNEQLMQWHETREASLIEDFGIRISDVTSLLNEGLSLQN